MATSRSDQRRRTSSSSRKRSGARSSSSENRRPLQGRDTGYRVGSSRRQSPARTINPRLIAVCIVGALILIALIFGISSCVRSCSAPKREKAEETKQVNEQDERVAYGVPAEETNKLSEVLDRNEAFAKIAANADKIEDERLIDLAIAEPEAIAFVAGSVKADGTTQAYGDTTPKGEYPQLYTFDKRWGYLEFGDGIVGVTGSGPVALAMASFGLSGKTTYDPSTIAEAITSAKLATGTSGMDDSFVSNHADEAGLVASTVDPSSDGIYSPLADMGMPVLIRLKSDSGVGTPNAHWALITKLNSDNSITVNDPTSVIASSHSWSLGAVSANTEAAYALSASTASPTTDDTTTTTTSDTDSLTGDTDSLTGDDASNEEASN